jgi:hypothetical protein
MHNHIEKQHSALMNILNPHGYQPEIQLMSSAGVLWDSA